MGGNAYSICFSITIPITEENSFFVLQILYIWIRHYWKRLCASSYLKIMLLKSGQKSLKHAWLGPDQEQRTTNWWQLNGTELTFDFSNDRKIYTHQRLNTSNQMTIDFCTFYIIIIIMHNNVLCCLVTLQVKHTICYNKLGVFVQARLHTVCALLGVPGLQKLGQRMVRYITGPSVCYLLFLYAESLSMAVI